MPSSEQFGGDDLVGNNGGGRELERRKRRELRWDKWKTLLALGGGGGKFLYANRNMAHGSSPKVQSQNT
jgi:hypothetical protein